MAIWSGITKFVKRFALRSGETPANTACFEDIVIVPKKTVAVVLDTPNGARTVEARYGRGVRPDLVQILKIARDRGVLTGAVAVANGGIPSYVLAEWRRIGYEPYCGLSGQDCDDSVTAKALSLGMRCDVLVLASGDHAYAPLVEALTRLGKEVIVTAVRKNTARILLSSASEFIDMPISRPRSKMLQSVIPISKSQKSQQMMGQPAEGGA